MVVTCYPFLHILAVRRPTSKPRQSSASDGSVTNLKSLSLTARTHASRSASRLNLTPTAPLAQLPSG
jgi:BRCT domain type II-containing protein